MKAFQLIKEEEARQLVCQEVEMPEVGTGQVLIKLSAAALNRRDFWICEGKYPGIKEEITLGSDGCGVIEAIGEEVEETWVGKQVIINPNINWGEDERVQGADYRILGMPDHGTFGEYIVVNVDRLLVKPEHLDEHQAAALPLAGLTAYRAVFTHAEIQEGDQVLISGFGGGVAQFAFQYSLALGAKVFVTTGHADKLAKAIKMGAAGGVNYREEGWEKELKELSGGFTQVIDSAGGDQVNKIIKLMKPAGRYVFYGASLGLPENIDLYRVFYNQLRIQGTTMGSDQEFSQMVDFVTANKIIPLVDAIIPFEEAQTAFDKMREGSQLGKIVLSFAEKEVATNKLQSSVSKVKNFIKGIWKKKS